MSETMASIAQEVAARHGLAVSDLKSPSRARKYAFPRHEAMFEIRHRLPRSWTQIGVFFNRDHSTAMTAVERHALRKAGVISSHIPEPKPPYKGTLLAWTDAEEALLASLPRPLPSSAKALFPNRTWGALLRKRRRMVGAGQ